MWPILSEFLKFLVTNFFTIVAQMSCEFLGLIWKTSLFKHRSHWSILRSEHKLLVIFWNEQAHCVNGTTVNSISVKQLLWLLFGQLFEEFYKIQISGHTAFNGSETGHKVDENKLSSSSFYWIDLPYQSGLCGHLFGHKLRCTILNSYLCWWVKSIVNKVDEGQRQQKFNGRAAMVRLLPHSLS